MTEHAGLASELAVTLHGEPDAGVESAWATEVERRALTDESKDRDWADVRFDAARKYRFR